MTEMKKTYGLENCEEVYPLTVTEAFKILQAQQGKAILDIKRSQFQKTFISAFKYAEMCSKIPLNKIEELRGLLQEYNLEKDEIAAIGSLLPQNSEEAKILIPSLERFGNEIETIIEKVNSICND